MRRKKTVNSTCDVCCPFQEVQVLVPVFGMTAIPKLLEQGTVCQVDSDNIYIGGKFKLNWKKISDFSLAEDSFHAGIDGGIQVSARVDQGLSPTWSTFAEALEKRWDKLQRRRTEKEAATQQMEKPLPVKRAYQPKRSKASHFLSKNMQNIKDWDSDDDLVFNRQRPKDLLEAQKKRRARQQEQDIHSESDRDEPEILDDDVPPSSPHATEHLEDQDLDTSYTPSEDKNDHDDNDYKVEARDTKRKTRKLKRKRRIHDESDDESLFESPPVTTPTAQHIVTPGTTFRKPVLDDNDDDDDSQDETKTSIVESSKKKLASSITNFFAPRAKDAAPSNQKVEPPGDTTIGKRAAQETKIQVNKKHIESPVSTPTKADISRPGDRKPPPTGNSKGNAKNGSSVHNNFFAPRRLPTTGPKTTSPDKKHSPNTQDDDDTVGSTPPDEIPTQYFDEDSVGEEQHPKATSTTSTPWGSTTRKPLSSSTKRTYKSKKKRDDEDDPIENFDEPTSKPDLNPNTKHVSPPTTRHRRLFPRKSHYGSKPPTKSTSAARALELANNQSPRSNLFLGMDSATPAARKSDHPEQSPVSSLSQLVMSPIRPSVKSTATSPEERPILKWRGLRNLGNTCYINASLQMLYSIPPFVDSLKPFCQSHRLISTFCQIYESLHTRNNEGAATARALKFAVDAKTPKFRGFQQRDAHEFLGDLIDQVHEEIHSAGSDEEKKDDTLPSKPEVAPTDEFFRLNVEVCLQCKSCDYSRTKEEMYRYLSVDIDSEEIEKPSDQGNSSVIAASVERCLKNFFQPEDRELKCEKCNQGNVATQTMRILSLPRALVIHLKRFKLVERPVPRDSNDKDEDRPPAMEITFQKSPAPVELTQTLSLKDYLVANHESRNGASSQYILRSIVHHIGSTADSGHYTADALRLYPADESETIDPNSPKRPTPTWVSYDDGITKETTLHDIQQSTQSQQTAYMLLYSIT